MRLDLSAYFEEASAHYKSPSQIARVTSESWFLENAYCPACAAKYLKDYPANQPVIDFYCVNCRQEYQLKGKRHSFGRKVLDGEYDTMMQGVNGNKIPNFAFLVYDLGKLMVTNLFFVPRYFFSHSIIEPRKPLSAKAKRHGWTGCNILFFNIPEIAKIHAIKDNEILNPGAVHNSWDKIRFMSEFKSATARGWTSDVIRCVDLIGDKEFRLSDCYEFEGKLKELHPENRNVRPKIRQQLQIMRDKGLIEFLGDGRYKKR